MLRKTLALILGLTLILTTAGGLGEMKSWDVENRLSRFSGGVRNPLKGWRADADLTTRFGTLVRFMVPWNEIERTAADGVERIIAYSQETWGGAAYRNCKIIPGVPGAAGRGHLLARGYAGRGLFQRDVSGPAFRPHPQNGRRLGQ